MEKCAGALSGGGLEVDESEMPGHGIRKRPVGAELREFHDLLKEQVTGRKWGGLRRALTKTGDHLWLCPRHYDIYEPPLPIVE